MPKLRKSLAWTLVLLCLSAATTLYYRSPLRNELEGRIASLKTKIVPEHSLDQNVVVVPIDSEVIELLDGAQAKDLSYQGLNRLLQAILAHKPRAVVALLHTQVYPYDGESRPEISRLANAHPELFLGVFDLKRSLDLPNIQKFSQERSYAIRLVQRQWEEVISDVLVEENGANDSLKLLFPELHRYLDPLGAQRFKTSIKDSYMPWLANDSQAMAMRLNYQPLNLIPKLKPQSFLESKSRSELRDKIVIVGYGVFRPNRFRVAEATFLNTPWQKPGANLEHGVAVTDIVATAVSNLIHEDWLRRAPLWLNVLQTLFISTLALLVWRVSISLAVLAYSLGFAGVLLAQTYIRHKFHLEIPIADSWFFATMMTFIGGFWRLRREIHLRAVEEGALQSEQELFKLQERFLSRFSFELSADNQEIETKLAQIQPAISHEDTRIQDAHNRCVEAAKELESYLSGIRELVTVLKMGHEQILTAQVNIGAAITKVIASLRHRFDEKTQEVQLSVSSDLKAEADLVMLEQIIHNLLTNASQYSPPHSKILITVTESKKHVVVSVTDQGPGIPKEYQDKIFEKFYRIPNDAAYQVKGTGMGLFLSRYFASAMGAALILSSTPPNGCSFTLSLRR